MYLFTFMLLFRLTTEAYLSPLLVYMPIDVPVHGPMCSFSDLHSDYPLRSTRSRFYCLTCPQTTCSSVYLFSLLLFFGITSTMTFQLIYWGTYTQIHPKIYLPVYLHAFLSSNHKDLPVTTTTCVHVHRCARSWPYLFMFILSFLLTV